MPTLPASPLESWFLPASSLSCHHQSKLPVPLSKSGSFVATDRRRPALVSTGLDVAPKFSKTSFSVLSSVSGGDAVVDRDEGDSSSSSSSSSDESDSSSDYSFLPSSKLRSAAGSEGKGTKKTPAQTALVRALAYKKSKGAVAGQQPVGKGLSPPSAPPTPPGNLPKLEIIAGKAFGASSTVSSSWSPSSTSPSLPEVVPSPEDYKEQKQKVDVVTGLGDGDPSLQQKGDFSGGGKEQEKLDNVGKSGPQGESGVSNNVVALSAFERAQAYKEQQAEMVAAPKGQDTSPPAETPSPDREADDYLEVEIYTRDGVIKRKTVKPEKAFSRVKDVKRTGLSQMDFAGLGFADKKTSSTPAGLMKGLEVATPSNRPEVEIITRQVEDAGSQGDESLYKPKVSSWGMFPRPADISKTYGGGRTIMPGEKLETEEEKSIREAQTKKLLEEYRRRMGLDIDPQTRAQTQKAIKQGESLMEQGSMREALEIFEGVMDRVSFQSDLHGLAALQYSVCLEATGRSADAKLMYEKLVSHPNYGVRKKAKQLLFGFQAMDKLKVSSSYKWDDGLYKKYFNSFSDGYNTAYRAADEPEESWLLKAVPYVILLLPVFLVVSLALRG